MDNKKILVSFLLVVLIALSVSAVSAEDAAADVLAVDDAVDEVAVADDTEEVVSNNYVPDAQNATGIQNAVDSAQPGDTVLLDGSYDFGDACVNVVNKDNLTIDGQGKTVITGYGSGDGIFYVSKSKSVTFTGITFIDNNPKNNFTYGGTVAGWGVQFNGNDAQGGVVDNCSFTDFNQAVVVKSCDHITVKNSEFLGGYSTVLVNMPLVNKEQGTKAVSVGGSFFTTIENCIFDGPMLDGISIAQASGDAKIIGNTFKNNVYSIFFGGASTDGTFITGNTFINCGSFSGEYKGEPVFWEAFPVISIQKASSGVYIDNNTFEAINNNWLIAAEQGNTAHGYPSTLGDINVTNNIVNKYDENVTTTGITLLHILCRSGVLNPYAPITVTGNTFVAGMKPVVIWSNDWGSESDSPTDIVIPAAPAVQTVISVTDASFGKVTAVLKDINGKGLASENVTYTVNGTTYTGTTDEKGVIVIDNATGEVAIKFAATGKYAAAETTALVPEVSKPIQAIINVSDITIYALSRGEVSVLLTDIDGNPLANRSILFVVDGEIVGVADTDENGTVSGGVQFNEFGVHNAVVYYAGDETTTAAMGIAKINVKKLATTSTVTAAKSYKVKKAKYFYVTVKSGKTKLNTKLVYLTINGKTYKAYTNKKGVATFKLTKVLLKAGTYKYSVKFAGDNTYKASTASGKLVVKK